MKTAGIDPSSSRCGIAIVAVDGVANSSTFIDDIQTWDVRGHKGKWLQEEIPGKLDAFAKNLAAYLIAKKVDRAVVELLSVTHNMDTVRKIAYFEGAALLACAAARIPVESMRTTQARKLVFGKGNIGKDEVRIVLEEMFQRRLTPDEADALVLAIAAQGPSQELP